MDLRDWCRSYIESATIEGKLAPTARPDVIEDGEPRSDPAPVAPLRLDVPGRDPRLRVIERAERIPRPGALVEASARAKLLHVFLHHEVQAAELSAWALLAFPDTPIGFRRGLAQVLDDEVRHAALYEARLQGLGSSYGAFAVRDWFWQRIPTVATPLQYTALMGLGFEGGNLEHAARFEGQLAAAGDHESARLVGQVGREEVAHVRFAARWFAEWTGADPEEGPDFDRWRDELPPPITPAVLRGTPLEREARGRAGLSARFLDRLEDVSTDTTRR